VLPFFELVVLGFFFETEFKSFVGCVTIRQGTSRNVKERQGTSRNVNKRQGTSTNVKEPITIHSNFRSSRFGQFCAYFCWFMVVSWCAGFGVRI
jgi:hypothetical protein